MDNIDEKHRQMGALMALSAENDSLLHAIQLSRSAHVQTSDADARAFPHFLMRQDVSNAMIGILESRRDSIDPSEVAGEGVDEDGACERFAAQYIRDEIDDERLQSLETDYALLASKTPSDWLDASARRVHETLAALRLHDQAIADDVHEAVNEQNASPPAMLFGVPEDEHSLQKAVGTALDDALQCRQYQVHTPSTPAPLVSAHAAPPPPVETPSAIQGAYSAPPSFNHPSSNIPSRTNYATRAQAPARQPAPPPPPEDESRAPTGPNGRTIFYGRAPELSQNRAAGTKRPRPPPSFGLRAKRATLTTPTPLPGEEAEESSENSAPQNGFRTAREMIPRKKLGSSSNSNADNNNNHLSRGANNGGTARTKMPSKFGGQKKAKRGDNDTAATEENPLVAQLVEDERCSNVDPVLLERICNEILTQNIETHWEDIAGLGFAKQCVQEIVIWPMMQPELFGGLREPPRGLLLFGPPGTGKTLIGRAIATEAKSTFFNISASTLTSKWVGEGEKMVRALFVVARCLEPAVIFVDEIDSLLTQRSESDQEASRRIKTEFLVQMEGAGSGKERLLVVGATNRPQELDEAVRRRMTKRLYIPLPNVEARVALINNLLSKMKKEEHAISDEEIRKVADETRGYSGSDLTALCKEAAYVALREIALQRQGNLSGIRKEDVRPITYADFVKSLATVRSSVGIGEIRQYRDWNSEYGSWAEAVKYEDALLQEQIKENK